jgi:hypothetical protein
MRYIDKRIYHYAPINNIGNANYNCHAVGQQNNYQLLGVYVITTTEIAMTS